MRSETKAWFRIGFFTNMKLVYSITLGIIIQIILVTIPVFSGFFNVVNLNRSEWIISIILSIIPFILNEFIKLFRQKK